MGYIAGNKPAVVKSYKVIQKQLNISNNKCFAMLVNSMLQLKSNFR